MKIHLMDPGLQGRAGHHFDLDLKLARTLADAGHTLRIYAHAQAAVEVLRAFEPVAPVTPLFHAYPYFDPRKFDPHAGELMAYLHQTRVLAEDLRSVEPAEVWLWPTLTASQLNACASAGTQARVSGCVHTEARTPTQPHGAMWWRHALIAASRARLRLRFGALEDEMRYDYQPLMAEGEFQVFPNFYEGKPLAAPRRELRRIGFFGHQRGEKGGALIPALVNELEAKGYDVVLQDSQQQFKPLAGTRVNVLGFVDDLAREIATCDLVVLPYEPENYRRKASGILLDAFASGVPVVAPFDTLPGRWIERTGAGTQFIRAETAQILAAIEAAARRYDRIAEAAARTAQQWRSRFGVDRFAHAMLG